MTGRPLTDDEYRKLLNDVMLSASVFAFGRGMPEARKQLRDTMNAARQVLNETPCARDPKQTLREMADAADEERRQAPNFRADQEG